MAKQWEWYYFGEAVCLTRGRGTTALIKELKDLGDTAFRDVMTKDSAATNGDTLLAKVKKHASIRNRWPTTPADLTLGVRKVAADDELAGELIVRMAPGQNTIEAFAFWPFRRS